MGGIKMRNIIGILGGMGPKSSLLLHDYILKRAVDYCETSTDQGYPGIIHFSLPELIQDRTAYILGKSGKNPGDSVFQQALLMEKLASELHQNIIIGIPCNTFFASDIANVFYKKLDVSNVQHLKVINIIEETTDIIAQKYSSRTKIGVLSTSGERSLEVYKESLERKQMIPLLTDSDLQKQVQECIFNERWGLKSSSADKTRSVGVLDAIIKKYKGQGAQAVILGCTELSLVADKLTTEIDLLDSMDLLAHRLLKETTNR